MAESKAIDYRKLSNQLDEILEQLQSGEIDIDDAIAQYGRGMEIVEQLQKYLKEAQNKVTKIKKDFSV